MKGKDKCRILKDIRAQIAQSNDIEWVVSECTHKGDCKGTCPKCESEVRKLERELEIRRRLGKAVAITGVSAACMAGLSACSVEDIVDTAVNAVNDIKTIISSGSGMIEEPTEYELDGDVYIDPYIDDLQGYVPAESFEPMGDYPINYDGMDEVFVTDGEVPVEWDE